MHTCAVHVLPQCPSQPASQPAGRSWPTAAGRLRGCMHRRAAQPLLGSRSRAVLRRSAAMRSPGADLAAGPSARAPAAAAQQELRRGPEPARVPRVRRLGWRPSPPGAPGASSDSCARPRPSRHHACLANDPPRDRPPMNSFSAWPPPLTFFQPLSTSAASHPHRPGLPAFVFCILLCPLSRPPIMYSHYSIALIEADNADQTVCSGGSAVLEDSSAGMREGSVVMQCGAD